MDERSDLPPDDLADEIEGDEALSPFFGISKNIIERYNHCALCGANLHFIHFTDFSLNLTQEIAKCPECGIKVRKRMHKLQ